MNLRAIRLLLIALVIAEAALWFRGPQPKDHFPDIAAATAAGKRPDWWDDAAMGVHFAAAIGGVGLLVLLGTSKWWSRSIADCRLRIADLKSNFDEEPTGGGAGCAATSSSLPLTSSNPQWFWPLIIAAALLGLGLRLPLASKSLWWDEAWVIEQVSLGRWKPDSKQPDKVKFQAHDWSRCAWYYQKPTNHAPMSLLQKVSITAWQKITGAKRDQFSDLSARVPALAASCLAVILLGLLLRGWGSPGAGVAAAFVLAVHPWYIRYGVDARAYALVVPLCIGGMMAVTRIIQTRGKKILPWLGWGTTEFLWLWAYPNAVLDIAALNLVAAFLLWKSHPDKQDRWSSLSRLTATNAFAAICLIQVFLPNLMQARHWAGQEADKHVLDVKLAASTLSQLFFGREDWFSNNSLVFVCSALVAFVASQVLMFTSKNSPKDAKLILLALMVSSVAFAAMTWLFGSYFYPRFIIALLPVIIATICLRNSSSRFFLAAIPFLAAWLAPMQFYLTRPYQPLHDVAFFVQVDSGKQLKTPIVACYGLGREVMPVYYPASLPVENAAGLQQVLRQAQTEQRSLYVIYGYNSFNRSLLADGFKLLDDPARFTPLQTFDGIESEFTFHVLKATNEASSK